VVQAVVAVLGEVEWEVDLLHLLLRLVLQDLQGLQGLILVEQEVPLG
jgi:hypothetical protein